MRNPFSNEGRKIMTAANLDQAALRQFTGSETWYRHSLNRRVLYTDGAKYVRRPWRIVRRLLAAR